MTMRNREAAVNGRTILQANAIYLVVAASALTTARRWKCGSPSTTLIHFINRGRPCGGIAASNKR